jgi:voltage-gated potassium channel
MSRKAATAKQSAPLTPRRRAYLMLEPDARPGDLSLLNKIIAAAIVVASAAAILETEPAVAAGREALLFGLEAVFVVIFSAEYAARVWVAAENPKFGGGWRGRLRWMLTPSALLDLAATLPVILTAGQAPTYLLRLVRLLRLARFAKLGRFSRAHQLLAEVIWSRRHELWAAISVGLIVLMVASSLLYVVEGEAQPDKFGSIPRALWWGVITLTTIGYGDVYPITPLGKVLAGATSVIAIGLVAAPTGILASAFAEALHNERREREGKDEDED